LGKEGNNRKRRKEKRKQKKRGTIENGRMEKWVKGNEN